MSEPDLTVDEIRAGLLALRARVGEAADISIGLSAGRYSDSKACGYCSPKGVTRGDSFHVDGSTWREVIEKMNARWDEQQDTYTAETIRRMALEIISTTLDLGECSDAALRGRGFNQAEIDRLGACACEVANEMAGKGPFEIVAHAANANAPAEAA